MDLATSTRGLPRHDRKLTRFKRRRQVWASLAESERRWASLTRSSAPHTRKGHHRGRSDGEPVTNCGDLPEHARTSTATRPARRVARTLTAPHGVARHAGLPAGSAHDDGRSRVPPPRPRATRPRTCSPVRRPTGRHRRGLGSADAPYPHKARGRGERPGHHHDVLECATPDRERDGAAVRGLRVGRSALRPPVADTPRRRGSGSADLEGAVRESPRGAARRDGKYRLGGVIDHKRRKRSGSDVRLG